MFVGFFFSVRMVPSVSRSSGAQYRTVQPWFGVEALTESMFLVIEQRPKSERRGLPPLSTRIFGWGWGKPVEEKKSTASTYALEISMDNFVAVEILETAGNPNHLHSLWSPQYQTANASDAPIPGD